MVKKNEHAGEESLSSQAPLVTVVTVVYNNAETVEQTMRSVAGQTYPHVEYIVVDGGSTDGTLDVIRRREEEIDRWVSEPDDGIYDAMNKGIGMASGELIGLLNSDDLYYDNTIEAVVQAYEAEGRPCVLYGDMYKFFDEDEPEAAFFRGDLTPQAFEALDIQLNHPTCFVHRDVYARHGRFDTRYKTGADRELMIRLHRTGVPFRHVRKVLARFRMGGHTSSQTVWEAIRAACNMYEYLRKHDYAFWKVGPLVGKQALRSVFWAFARRVLGENRTRAIQSQRLKRKFQEA